MADDDNNEEVTTEPMPVFSEDEEDMKATTALPSVGEEAATNPVHASLSADDFAAPEDETEFLRSSDVDPSGAPTIERRADASADLEAKTLDSTDQPSLQRRQSAASGDDETLKAKAHVPQRERQPKRGEHTRPAQLVDVAPSPAQPAPPAPATPQSQPEAAREPSAFWKKESFWGGNPSTQPADVRAVEKALSAPNPQREQRAFKTALAAGFACAVIVMTIAISTWMSPAALFGLSVLMAIPIGLLTAWFARPRDLSLASINDVRLLLKPIGIGAAVVILAGLPWQVGFVRKVLRAFAPQSAAVNSQVLADRSDAVAVAECERLATTPDGVNALATGLPGRPAVTRRCFSGSAAGEETARALLEAWRPSLVASNVPDGHACGIARSASALPLPTWEVQGALADCVIESSSAVQKCCGTALAGLRNDEANRAAPPDDWAPEETAAASLLRLTLDEVTDQQTSIRKAARLDDDEARGVAIELACRATERGANLGPVFLQTIPRCSLSRADYPTDPAAWQKVCASMRARLRRGGKTPVRALCDAAMARGALPTAPEAAE